MRRSDVDLCSLLRASMHLGLLQPPITVQAQECSETTASKSKLSASGMGMRQGAYSISFYCQHKSNNEARHKHSHAVFLLDGEEVAFGDNATRAWSTFSNTYEIALEEGDHTFEIKHSAEGGVGVSIIQNAEITVSLQRL